MAYETLEMLIGGQWTAGGSGAVQDVVNPATGEVLGALPLADSADLDRALAASAEGFAIWRRKTPLERQVVMEGAARLMEDRRDALAVTLTREMGKPLAEARAELDFAIGVLRWYAEEGKRAYGRVVAPRLPGLRHSVLKEPVGPVAAFTAWNFPALNVMRKVAGALGAGCSIVIKASEETPATCIAIMRCLAEAGAPPGVVNAVFGDPDQVSRHLIASPVIRKISLTGSVAVGQRLQALAAETLKRCTLELGGHAPCIVFDDVDLDETVKTLVAGKFRNAGQICVSPTRFYVHDAVREAFAQRFAAAAEAITVGDGLAAETMMGPLAAGRRLAVMQGFVDDAVERGARLLTGGRRIGNHGVFYAPTVLDGVDDAARIMTEEPFGPVVPIAGFSDLDDVVTRANSLPFGLASYAFVRDPRTARRVSDGLEAGLVGVNSLAITTPELPFGGIKQSGYGSEGGVEGLDAYLQPKVVTELAL